MLGVVLDEVVEGVFVTGIVVDGVDVTGTVVGLVGVVFSSVCSTQICSFG